MKPLLSFFLLCVLCAFLSLLACSGDDPSPIEQLPPATQTGAETIGCLINGKAFTPKGAFLGPPSRGSSYQFIYNDGDSFFNFQVFARHLPDPFQSVYMNVIFQNFEDLQEDRVYFLGDIILHKGQAGYGNASIEIYETNSQHTGTLTITHYDYDNRIVSGTFEFEVEVDGEVLKVTDGRFDMTFTI